MSVTLRNVDRDKVWPDQQRYSDEGKLVHQDLRQQPLVPNMSEEICTRSFLQSMVDAGQALAAVRDISTEIHDGYSCTFRGEGPSLSLDKLIRLTQDSTEWHWGRPVYSG